MARRLLPRPAYFAGRAYPASRGASTRPPDFTPDPSGSPTSTTTRTVPFDYGAYLANEPTLQAEINRINTAGLTQRSNLVGGEQQLFGRLGEAPDLSDPRYANLPPALRRALQDAITPDLRSTIADANRSGVSALARLQHDVDVGQSTNVGSLIARGMLHSGELGQRLNESTRALTLGQYDVRQKALDAFNQLQSSYLSGQNELATQAGTAVTQAQQRAGQLINLGQLGPYTTTQTVTNPYLNPAAPKQVSTPTTVGSSTSYEPHATAANFAAPKPPAGAPKIAAPYKTPSLGTRALR